MKTALLILAASLALVSCAGNGVKPVEKCPIEKCGRY